MDAAIIEKLVEAIESIAYELTKPDITAMASLFVATMSVVISVIALYATSKNTARQEKLLDQQNRIALFDKRFALFDLVMSCKQLSSRICDHANTNQDVWRYVTEAIVDITHTTKQGAVTPEAQSELMIILDKIKQIPLIFSTVDYCCLGSLNIELQKTVDECAIKNIGNLTERKKILRQALDAFEEAKIEEKMVAEIDLNK